MLAAIAFLVSAGSIAPQDAAAHAAHAALQAKAASPAATPDPNNPVVKNCNVTQPDAAIAPALLTSGLPCDFQFGGKGDLPSLQQNFDFYSWLTFLALNTPAGGTIAKGSGVTGDAPAAWEQWKSLSDIMRPDGSRPTPWGQHDPPPAKCGITQRSGSNVRVLSMVAKLPDVLSVTNQPFA
ncbi:MAG TPA: hypothetical protein VN224_04695, partial [Xanthomonadales bacterium]|nr:hypothetical protein [Xanthomonadales bacterium]